MGSLGWEPDVFWAATPEELIDAYEGKAEWEGRKKAPKPMTRKRLEDLMREYPD